MEKRYSKEIYNDVIENMRGLLQNDRPEGVHLSDLTLCLNKAYYRRVEGDQELTDEQVTVFSLGRMGEAWMRQSFSDAEPILCEGIWCSIDHDGGDIPWEIKVTKMSSNTPIPRHWLCQMMAYAYARYQCKVKRTGKNNKPIEPLDGKWLEFANVRLCVNGDYKANRQMIVVPEVYTFTQDELEENWDWLQHRLDTLEYCVKKGVPPSRELVDYEGLDVSFNQCNGCGYSRGICPAERRGR